ncbi:MAG: Eco57I restriction-modification methylase domain-containing protein, partial [Actinomycetota bacterium]|nr:Eco57I restriction-modification methylase domain-containing protein [Actinomycetota bacterium]
PLVLSEAASFRGVAIWVCPSIPSGQVQRVVDKVLRKESAERVVIFHDEHRQVWRWPQARDAAGAGTPRLVAHEHHVGMVNEALRQRLQFVQIGINEDDISVLEVVRRLRRAFDSDKVTKSFYSKFAEQHRDLTGAIKGIAVSDKATKPELRWYGSILLNRLMFIYFMQRKGFLDGDVDYLRNRLDQIRELKRPGSFYEFYKDFLIPLFHEGLGADTKNRVISDPAIEALIGDIPYINGGIFSKHPLEEANDIRVPDKAFEKIFDFFDQWQWHLDDRPSGNPNEINPDVLGYIFEQFVNNREEVSKGNKDAATNVDKGAYYTKEDVTGFMTSNALLPVFLERVQSATSVNVWRPLSSDPDRYVWPSLAHGCELSLPREIDDEAGTFPRPAWDTLPVPGELGLPTETWWEVVDRRRTHQDLVASAKAGKIASGDAAVRANVDLETLAIDVIDALDSPADVVAAWQCLSDLRIIDPTCGSGAFLFAALNILHRLYSAVLDAAITHARTSKVKALHELLESAKSHPNQDYFLLKHAALNNIYGVDLMPEAVEIARLRLFLKLISQVDDRRDIQPLPDLEFSIRAGNALVGAASVEDIRARVDLLNHDRVDEIVARAEEATAAFRKFAEVQEAGEHLDVLRAKALVIHTTEELRAQLDEWWWESVHGNQTFDKYKALVTPLHWLVEFPEAMSAGGFDVVIGNPPYVPKGEIDYPLDDFETRDLPDIYAPCLERALSLLNIGGRLAMITPHSLMQSSRFKTLRLHIASVADSITCSAFARIPAGLFENDVRVRNTILICRRSSTGSSTVASSRCRRWYSEFRPHVMALVKYADIPSSGDTWPFVDDPRLLKAFDRLREECSGTIARDVVRTDTTGGSRTLYYKANAYNYLSVAGEPVPVINADGSRGETSEQGTLPMSSVEARDFAYVLLAGRIGLSWWAIQSDDFHLTKGILEGMPGNHAGASQKLRKLVAKWAPRIADAQAKETVWKLNKGKKVGNWNLAACRDITDQADLAVLSEIGCTTDEIEAIWTFYHRIYMSGSE